MWRDLPWKQERAGATPASATFFWARIRTSVRHRFENGRSLSRLGEHHLPCPLTYTRVAQQIRAARFEREGRGCESFRECDFGCARNASNAARFLASEPDKRAGTASNADRTLLGLGCKPSDGRVFLIRRRCCERHLAL